MNITHFLKYIVIALIMSACATSHESITDTPPINLIPMYGYPSIEKTTDQKKADKFFIETAIQNSGSLEKASMEFAGEAWRKYEVGDYTTAMRRFNQAWLLNQDNYFVHWGFSALLFDQGKTDEAISHYDKALSVIDNVEEKPRLLTDTARAYSKKAYTEADKLKSKELFRKTNSLYKEALILDPHYDNAYRDWPRSLYLEGNYEKAWEIIKQSRTLGNRDISQDFIDLLSKKMPEPE